MSNNQNATDSINDENKKLYKGKDKEQLENKYGKDLSFRGLTNKGATCYMNSLIQNLYHIFEFR